MNERIFDEAFLRRLEHLALHTRRAASGQQQGERRSKKHGQSVEFADFRLYTPGDDFRRIDWNAYARLERLFIKLFVEEEDLTLHLLIDSSHSMEWGEPTKLAYAARTAGALGYISLLGLDQVTVTALGSTRALSERYFPAVRGKVSAVPLFGFLRRLFAPPLSNGPETNQSGPLAWLSAYLATVRRPGPAVLMSDLMDDGWQPALNLMAGRGFDLTIIQLLTPDELAPELSGDFKLVDAETAVTVELTADYETLERYRRHLAEWQAGWRRFSASRGIHYLTISTALPLEELLFAQLPRQGVLR
jgi:uncharacterized protein (DUF58 family)